MWYSTKLRILERNHKWHRNTEKSPTFQVMRKMQIKTTLKFCFASTRMATINKT